MMGVKCIDAAADDDDDDPLCETIICAYSPFVWSLSTPGCIRALLVLPFFSLLPLWFSLFSLLPSMILRFEHRHEKVRSFTLTFAIFT